METWQTILLAIGGNTAVVAVLGFLGKSLLEKLVTRDTKRFESDLKAKSDAAIEHLKGELQLKAVEHKERFSRLHEKRATVIAELYGCLVEMLWEAESFLSPLQWVGEPNQEEKHRLAMNKLVEFFRFFDKNRIYLPEELCESLEKLAMQVRSHIISSGVYIKYKDETLNDHTRESKEKAWNAGWGAIRNEVPQARKLLEERFRGLLGAGA
ncbi:MAG: hypothetical protein EAZ30_00055 [Betaproteobacteria bacterium]|nr:MAG: hypothetical protein EAZ43_15995 [Betaproteobacteria bacterium]TAG50436.1 MAG: hypothetical protein EAZ30_00055 [Betaproteobacteria bacterium]